MSIPLRLTTWFVCFSCGWVFSACFLHGNKPDAKPEAAASLECRSIPATVWQGNVLYQIQVKKDGAWTDFGALVNKGSSESAMEELRRYSLK